MLNIGNFIVNAEHALKCTSFKKRETRKQENKKVFMRNNEENDVKFKHLLLKADGQMDCDTTKN